MGQTRWQHIADLFAAAADKPANERAMFVQAACGEDSKLAHEVTRLLAADESAGSFLEKPFLTDLTGAPPSKDRLLIFEPNTIVADRFELLRFIGQGGMGQVYEALDLELKGRVALKAVRPEIATDPLVLSRFRQEVLLTRQITHPNVCRTFDIDRHTGGKGNGSADGVTFLTMELLEGETLTDLLRREHCVNTLDALPLVLQMIDALNAAHSASIIHCDFKPSNILLVKAQKTPRVVVTDFGLARPFLSGVVTPQGESLGVPTGGSAWYGTLAYMSPEQLERGETTSKSDIYALGLVMYELVTGRRPFADTVPVAEAIRRLGHAASAPRTLVPELDPIWNATICRCLETQPTARFDSVLEVANSLTSSSKSRSLIVQRTGNRVERTTRGSTKKLAILGGLVLIVSLLLIGFRFYLWRPAEAHLSKRDRILVADFTNQTGERVFDRVVQDLAVQSLSQSKYLTVVPRLSALEAARRTGSNEALAIDEKLGRELCLREGYKALLTGGIYKAGAGYMLTMKVEVPSSGTTSMVDTESIETPAVLLAGVDRITARVRRSLGESLSHIKNDNKPLAEVTTTSLEALQRYSTALDLYADRQYLRSANLAKDAVEIDHNFAMAHLLLAKIYEQRGNESAFREQLSVAGAGLNRVSEREQHLILAAQYSARLMNEQAAQEYQHLLDIFPDDVEALNGFAYEAFWAGHPDEAIVAQKRLVELIPDEAGSYEALINLLVRTNDFQQALDVYAKAKARKIHTASLVFATSLAFWGRGDFVRAQQMLDSLNDEDDVYWKIVSRIAEGRLLAFQGRLAEALTMFRTGKALVQVPGSENWLPVFQYQIAKAEIGKGHKVSAKKECDEYRKMVRNSATVAELARGGSLFVEMGDLPAARRLEKITEQSVRRNPDPFSEMELHSLRGQIELATGNAERAEQEADSALAFHKWYTPYLVKAGACEANRKWPCAIESYRRYLSFEGEIIRDDVGQEWSMAYLSLARVYFEAGDRSSGDTSFKKFQQQLSFGDTDLPIQVQAAEDAARWNIAGLDVVRTSPLDPIRSNTNK